MVTYTVGENDDVRRIRRCIVLSTVVIALFFILVIGVLIGVFYYMMNDFKSGMGDMGNFMSMMGGGGAGTGGPYGGKQQPGVQQPGMQQPGMQQPGMQQPGLRNPDAVRQRPEDGSQQPNDMPQPGMSGNGAQSGMPEPGVPQGGSHEQPGTDVHPEPVDPDKESSVVPEPDSGSTTKPNTPTDGNIAHNTLYSKRLEIPSPTSEGTKYNFLSKVATSFINIPERDSPTSADTTTVDGSSVTRNADITFSRPSDRLGHSGITANRTKALHLTETTTAMKMDNKLQIVGNIVTTETPKNNVEITEPGVIEFRHSGVDLGSGESQRRTNDDSNGDINTFVTTTHDFNRNNNDRSTDKEGTNNVIDDDIQYSSNVIVETESTTVVSHSKDSVQEPRRAINTESKTFQTTATVNVATDNSKYTKDTFSIESTVNILDNHGYSDINGALSEGTTRDMSNGEKTDSFPVVKATNVDSANKDLDSTESTTLSNVDEPDPGDGDKITQIQGRYPVLNWRPTGQVGTTEEQGMTSATTDTGNTDFSDLHETYLNTKSQERAKTSEVNNLDVTLKYSVSSSPSPGSINVKEMIDETKTTEGTETSSDLGGNRKITTISRTTSKVDLLTNHSSIGIGGSNFVDITPKVPNVEQFTDDSSHVSDATADAIGSIKASDFEGVTADGIINENLKHNTVVNDTVSYIQDVTVGITDSSDIQENGNTTIELKGTASTHPSDIEDNDIGNKHSGNEGNGVNNDETSDVAESGIASIASIDSKDNGISSIRPSDNDIDTTELSDYEDNGASTKSSAFDVEDEDADNFEHSGTKDNGVSNAQTSDVDNQGITSTGYINTEDKAINSTRSSDIWGNVIEITQPSGIEYDGVVNTQHSDIEDNDVGSTRPVNVENDHVGITKHSDVEYNGLESTKTSGIQDTCVTSPNVEDNTAGSTQPADVVNNGGESTQPSGVQHYGVDNTQPSSVEDKHIGSTQSPKVEDIDVGNKYSSDGMNNGVDSTQSSDAGNTKHSGVVNDGVIDTQSSDGPDNSIESTQPFGVEDIDMNSTQSTNFENAGIYSTQPADGEDNDVRSTQLLDVEYNSIDSTQSSGIQNNVFGNSQHSDVKDNDIENKQSLNFENNEIGSTKFSDIDKYGITSTQSTRTENKDFGSSRPIDNEYRGIHITQSSNPPANGMFSTKSSDSEDNAVQSTKPFQDIKDTDIASTLFESSFGVLDKSYSTNTVVNLDDRDILAATELRKIEVGEITATTTIRDVSRNTQGILNGNEDYSTEMIGLEVSEDGNSKSSDFEQYSLGITPVSNVKHFVSEHVESWNADIESAERKNSMTATTKVPEDILQQTQSISSTTKRNIVVPPEPPDITQTSITYIDIQRTAKTADSDFPVTHALDTETTTVVRGTSNKRDTVGNIDDTDITGTFLVTTEINKNEVRGKRTTVISDSLLPVTDDSHAEATTDLHVRVHNDASHVDDVGATHTTDVKRTTVKTDDFSHVTNHPDMEGTTGVPDKSHSTKIASNVDATDGWRRSATTKTITDGAGNERTSNIPGDASAFRNDSMANNTDETDTTDEGNNFVETKKITTAPGEMNEDITRGNILGTLIAKYTTRTHSQNRINPTTDTTSSIEAGASETVMGGSHMKDAEGTTTVDTFTIDRSRSNFSRTIVNVDLFTAIDNLSDHTVTKETTPTVNITVDTMDSNSTDNVTSLNVTWKDTNNMKVMHSTSSPYAPDGQIVTDVDINTSYSTGVENNGDAETSSPPQDGVSTTESVTTPIASITPEEYVEYVYRNTSQERIKGVVVDTSLGIQVERFLGVPYAVPPVGQRRFSDPVLFGNFTTVPYEAVSHGPACIQYPDLQPSPYSRVGQVHLRTSEDCLYLNVWTPHNNTQLKPVMVYIHGGSNIVGSGSEDLYDGTYLAAIGDVVVVTFNYRLNLFGWFHPAVNDTDVTGNQGLKDQALVLRWVRENIEEYGGDPGNVTLFGEISGATHALLHLLSPETQHLFNRLILQEQILTNVPYKIWPLAFRIVQPKKQSIVRSEKNVTAFKIIVKY